MNPLSTEPGLITRIEKGNMYVKVPIGHGCSVCPNKMSCTFSGPERAYRTFRVYHEKGCRVGDRVLVHVPGAVLGVTGLVFVGLPFLLILGGYSLLTCCMQLPYATFFLWVLGISLWLGAMYGANAWIERGVQFRERIEPVEELRRRHERISNPTGEDYE